MMKKNNKPKKRIRHGRRHGFWFCFAVYMAILTLLIVIGLIFFYHYMAAYEKSRPEHTIEQFLSEKDYVYWTGIIDSSATEFEGTDRIAALVGTDDLSECSFAWKKRVGEYSSEHPVYTVTANGISVVCVELSVEDKDFFGFPRWAVSSVFSAFDRGTAKDITIIAPSKAAVSVNGIILDDKYITESRLEYPGTSPLEEGCDRIPYRSSYAVPGLILSPTVEVMFEGRALQPGSIEGGVYVYGTAPQRGIRTEIVAPVGAAVYVNGKRLTDGYLSGETESYTLLSQAAGYAVQPEARVVYRVEELSTEPEVTAVSADGTALPTEYVEDGRYVFDYPASGATEALCSAWVEKFVREYISFTARGYVNTDDNFKALADAYLLPGSAAYEYMRSFKEGVKWNNPYDVTYRSLELYDFIPFGERCFSCRVSFDVVLSTYGIENQYSGKIRLLAVKESGEWRIADMILQAE